LDSDDDLNNVLATKQYDHFFSPLFHVATVGTGESLPFRNNNDERNKKATSYRLDIRYRGDAFCGWQRQNHSSLPAVQQVLEDWLQALQPDHGGCRKKPVDVRVCGRTDAGVHALSQVCRFRTSDKGLSEDMIQTHLNQSPWQHSLQCTRVTKVSSKFHPTFGATCRAYAYIIDWGDTLMDCSSVILVERLNTLLQPLVDQELDYYSMSYGPVTTQNTCCTLFLARVCRVNLLPINDPESKPVVQQQSASVIMFQLVANRFLRRMVRILVATAIQLAMDDSLWHRAPDDLDQLSPPQLRKAPQLLDTLQQQNRRASAKPAPAHGLMLMGADICES
jgi:tRNA pseudouridine(38-40) synthase